MPDPKPDDVDLHEETTDPLLANVRNFEKWTRDERRSIVCSMATNTGVRSVATAT